MSYLGANLMSLLSIAVVQLIAAISPGPSFLVTAQTAAARSRSDGIRIALGLGIGSVLWAMAAMLGLQVLFHTLPPLFVAAKILGALFILWVAFQIFRHAEEPLIIERVSDDRRSSFLKGFLTQVSNPKVAVFFGSIFVSMLPSGAPIWVTGTLFVSVFLVEFLWYSAVASFFGSARVRVLYVRAKTWVDRVTGVFLAALGLKLLIQARDAV